MAVDEWALRDTARDLANLYQQLNFAKHQPPAPRETRVMRPRPGPSAPGNWLMISRDAELVDHLAEMVCDARQYIQPSYTVGRDGDVLARWVAFNASAICELFPAADDLHDLLATQARKINNWLNPPGGNQPANPDPYLTAGSIQRTLTARGLTCPDGTIRRWASEGYIATRKQGPRTLYRLKDVQERLTMQR